MADDRKIGEGHFMAWIREGFKELAQALEAFPGQGIHHVEEPGLLGNPTPQIVTNEMGASTYKDMLMEAAQRVGPEQDRGMER
jgi:hypothetical protein